MLVHGFARFNVNTDAVKLVNYLFELAPQALQLRKDIISPTIRYIYTSCTGSQLPSNHPSFEAAEETATMIVKTVSNLVMKFDAQKLPKEFPLNCVFLFTTQVPHDLI